jgi:hypothetical protein
LNDSISESVKQELVNRGHSIKTTSGNIANPVMIYVDPDTGIIYTAGDPKAQRHAGALE